MLPFPKFKIKQRGESDRKTIKYLHQPHILYFCPRNTSKKVSNTNIQEDGDGFNDKRNLRTARTAYAAKNNKTCSNCKRTHTDNINNGKCGMNEFLVIRIN